jgi:hypothetical protein
MRDCCVAKNATLRAARTNPSLRKKTLVQDAIKLSHVSRIFFSSVFDVYQFINDSQLLWMREGMRPGCPSFASESCFAT